MKPIEYVVTGEEMQRYDANTIKQFKVPGLVLMEQAAFVSAEEIERLFRDKNSKILVKFFEKY